MNYNFGPWRSPVIIHKHTPSTSWRVTIAIFFSKRNIIKSILLSYPTWQLRHGSNMIEPETYSISGRCDKKALNTSHERHIFIFSCQFLWTLHSQMVPLINQQSLPDWNSQAGHCFFRFGGQFLITQHGFRSFFFFLSRETKKSTCRSTCIGTFLQPCS